MSGLSARSLSALAVRRWKRSPRSFRSGALSLCSLFALVVCPLAAQEGVLFPEAYRVEHHLVQDDGEGTRFVSEAVVDVYGGSWIVSQRPDGSRLIIDLARRELTEVRPDKGTYWTTSLDRLAELRDRSRAAQGLADASQQDRASDTAKASAGAAIRANGNDLVVTEVSATAESKSFSPAAGVASRPEVRHLRVATSAKSNGMALDVWVDPSIRFSAAAAAALGNLEAQLLTPAETTSTGANGPARFLAAARSHAQGALPVRTHRPLTVTREGAAVGAVDDVVTRVERLDRFPSELVEIPAGLRRVPHPLEATVRFLEEERERNRVLSGGGSR